MIWFIFEKLKSLIWARLFSWHKVLPGINGLGQTDDEAVSYSSRLNSTGLPVRGSYHSLARSARNQL